MTSQSIKGLVLPTAKPIPGGNPSTAAYQSGKQSAVAQDKLVSAVGGSRKKGFLEVQEKWLCLNIKCSIRLQMAQISRQITQ